MIDLAPHNPYSLTLNGPVVIAPGCGAPLREPDPALIGAVATRLAVRHAPPEGRVRWGAVAAGVVFERLPVVKLRSLLQAEAKRWARSPLPILLSLSGNPDELSEMAALLEPIESLSGLLLDAVSEQLPAAIAATRDQTQLPILALLPPDLPGSAVDCVAAGADALVVQAYPRGGAIADGELYEGLIVGPALAPRTLLALHSARQLVDVPLVALGGVADERIAQDCLQAGASAVMVDGALYGDPYAPLRIGSALRQRGA